MRKERFEVPAAKRRNPYALEASMRSGAGFHGHPARKESRNKCRTPIEVIKEDEDLEWEWFFDEVSDA